MAGFLLACGVGTYFMYNRNAKANDPPTAEAAAAQTTITQFLSDDKDNVNKMKDLLENTGKAVEQFRASPGKKQVPLDDLQTNPFRFARPARTSRTTTSTPSPPSGAPRRRAAATLRRRRR